MKKNISLTILSFFLFLLLTEIGMRYLIFSKKYFLFKTENHLNFYKKYTNHLHHLRDTIDHPKEPSGYLFNFIKKSDQKDTILFQGDSRANQIDDIASWDKDFFNNYNSNIVSGGSSSFSPSLMSVQLDILVKDFNIKPNILVALIDPTDLGDEYCRYKDKVIIEENKIKKVEKSLLKGDFYFYENIFLLSEINFSKKPKFIYLPKLIYHFFKYNLQTVSNCRFDEIQKYLINKDINAENHFNYIVNSYLNNIKSYSFIDQIYFVFYPHVQHIDKNVYGVKYEIKLNNVLKDTLSDKVNIIDFHKEQIFKDFKDNYFEVFSENDPASHLTGKGRKIFYSKILDKVLNN